MELTPIQQIAYDAVTEIQDIKRAGGKAPDFATIDEIVNYMREELLESLRGLYRGGKVEFHKTVNGILMFGVKE